MAKIRQRREFAHQRGAMPGIAGPNNFHCHPRERPPIELLVGLINDAKRAPPQFALKAIGADFLTNHKTPANYKSF